MTRQRRMKSIADELLCKAREAALAAVQIYNNPTIQFKAELFIVTINIAWTYLLHAYYRKKKVDYRYSKLIKTRRSYIYTKSGAVKHWDLQRCLEDKACPLDIGAINNLKFLIGLRNEIEHQMTNKIDNALSAKFQATCLNFNSYIKTLFNKKLGIDQHLSVSLQFASISPQQKDQLIAATDLPAYISVYISDFEKNLTDEQFGDTKYAYRVLFVQKTANRKGQSDKVVEFVKMESDIAKLANTEYEKVYLKEIDKKKYLAKDIIAAMIGEGFIEFNITEHTNLWKSLDAKNPKKGFSGQLGQQWYWYENWLKEVRDHCKKKWE